MTGELAVCAGSCGPGNLHLINGLFDCHRTRVPVLAIAAHIPSAEIGRGYFQETHPEKLFRECSHYCELVSAPAQMPRRAGDRRSARPSASAASPWWCCRATSRCRPRAAPHSAPKALLRRQPVVVPGEPNRSMRWRNCSTRARASRCSAAAVAPARTTQLMPLGRRAEGADRACAARQGACRVGQPVRRRDDRAASASRRATRRCSTATRC